VKRSIFKIAFLLRYDAVWFGRQVAHYTILGVIIQGVAIESYDFQIAVFMKWVGYKKQKKDYGVSGVKSNSNFALYFLKIKSLNWSPCPTIHDHKLTANKKKTQNLPPTSRCVGCG
jgi:hypothetical protein